MSSGKSYPVRGRGRPATGQTPKRYFRVDDETWAIIEQAAETAGLTVSEWMRDRLTKAANRELKRK